MVAKARIIPVEDLPASIWADNVLHISPHLVEVYRKCIESHNLMNLALEQSDSPVGGSAKEATDKHFAQAFCGSVARGMAVFLDPKSEINQVADALSSLFSGGSIAILDIPCGAGAFSTSILCTLAELRLAGVVPRQPIDVKIVGGEISEFAREYATELFDKLKAFCSEQAINIVEFKPMPWDVCDKISTTDVVNRFNIEANSMERGIVAISNFSGFLSGGGRMKTAQRQLEEIFRYSSSNYSSAIWLEPGTNVATNNILRPFITFLKKNCLKFVRFFGIGTDSEEIQQTTVTYTHPIKPGVKPNVHVAVVPFDLGKRAS